MAKQLNVSLAFTADTSQAKNAIQSLVNDLRFVKELEPAMCGIGPFIPHKDTPLRDCSAGTTEKTVILLAITRLLLPKVLLPATTALASIDSNGRNEALRAGANVIMPNLSPMSVRKKYSLYNNKAFILDEDAEYRNTIEEKLREAGFELVVSRGDNPDFVQFLNFKQQDKSLWSKLWPDKQSEFYIKGGKLCL